MTRPAALLVAAAAALFGLPAARAAEPFDPSGTLLEGTEVLSGIGESGVAIHFAADGTAAGSFGDPFGLARDWSGIWLLDVSGELDVLLNPVGEESADFITVRLRMSASGKGKGTVIRNQAPESSSSPVKVRVVFPAPKPKGWTAVVPRMRDTGAVAAGEFRGTLVVRNLAPPGRKPRPLALAVRAVGMGGLPGAPVPLSLLPGATARLAGGALPRLPPGMEEEAFQVVVTGGPGFDPAVVEILAVEEVLRGSGAETPSCGTALPVRWARALPRKQAASRDAAPLAAPWFRDDGGAGALPRDAVLVLRDLAPFDGGAPAGSVRVSVRTLAGAEVASASVPLPRGAAVEVRPRDLLEVPGDLPGGEGQVRVTREDGSGLPRGSVAAALLSTAVSSDLPAGTLSLALGQPDPEGPASRIVVPWFRLPDDGTSEMRLWVQNFGGAPMALPVAVLALDGTPLYSGSVPLGPGETARADPAALGLDPSNLPGGEGQLVLGPAGGLPRHLYLAHAEIRLQGTPDAHFALPAGFEAASADGAPFRVDLLDAAETAGSSPGDADAWLFVRNGGEGALSLTARVLDDAGAAVGSAPDVALVVAPGESRRISVEEALALAGAPLSGDASYRGPVEVLGTGPGPLAAAGARFLYGAAFPGGAALPAPIR